MLLSLFSCPADLGGDGLFSSGADLDRIPGIYQNGAEVRGRDGVEISKTWLNSGVLEKLVDWFHGLATEERERVGIAFQSYGDVYILAGPSADVDVPSPWVAVKGGPVKVQSLEKWSRAPYFWGEGWAQALDYEELKKTLLNRNVHCAMMLTTVQEQEYWARKAIAALGDLESLVYHCIGLSDPAPMDRSAYTFTHLEANKGNGLKLLLKHFGDVAARRSAAFGDNLNDKSMFLVEDVFGIAMDNAVAELKAVARAVTGSNEDAENAGVAHALNRITEAHRQCSEAEVQATKRLKSGGDCSGFT